MQFFRALALMLMLTAALPAAAQMSLPAGTSEKPDPARVPALSLLMNQQGSRAYFLGNEGGINGWFIIMPENRVQIAYTSLDGEKLIIGAMFGANGDGVTESQMVALREREPDVNKLFNDTVEQAKQRMAKSSGSDRLLKNLNPQSKGDQLYSDFAQVFNIQFGAKDAPLLIMAMDPNCPHCKNSWNELEPLLAKKNFQLRMVPVAILGEESARMSAILLGASNPATKWKQFAEARFDAKVLDGKPDETATAKLELNQATFERWKLNSTPFFIYRSKQGGVKILNQEPKDMAALIDDIAPLPAK